MIRQTTGLDITGNDLPVQLPACHLAAFAMYAPPQIGASYLGASQTVILATRWSLFPCRCNCEIGGPVQVGPALQLQPPGTIYLAPVTSSHMQERPCNRLERMFR